MTASTASLASQLALFWPYMSMLAVCSLRFYVILFMFPPCTDSILTGTVRNAVAVLFSTYVAWGQPRDLFGALTGTALVAMALREAMIGFVLGFAASSVFWVADGVGTYLDDLTGYNNVQITNPMSAQQSTPSALLLGQIAIAVFWSLGGMTFLLGTLYESFRWWPPAAAAPEMANILESFAMQRTDSLMQGVAKLAIPMVFILILIDLAFGYVDKSASKLNVSQLAQPVKGAVTVLMLAVFAGLFVDQLRGQLSLAWLAGDLHTMVHHLP